jgi:hypothetical protein
VLVAKPSTGDPTRLILVPQLWVAIMELMGDLAMGDRPEWKPPTVEESILQYLSNADNFVTLKQFDFAKKTYSEALSTAKKLLLDHKLDPFKYMLALTRATIGYALMNSESDAVGFMKELAELIDMAGFSGVGVPAPVKGILQSNLEQIGRNAKQYDQQDLVELISTLSERLRSF